MKRRRKTKYTHGINCKLTEQQFQELKQIKLNTGVSISSLLRGNIAFLISYYAKK